MSSEAPNTLLSDSYVEFLDVISEGPIEGFATVSGNDNVLTAVQYDGVQVLNSDGSANFNCSGQGFRFGYTLGTPNQKVIEGFEKVEAGLVLPTNPRVSNNPNGTGGVKNVTLSFNTELYPDADSIKVTLKVPALYSITDDGNTEGYRMSYAIDISLNNGPFQLYASGNIAGKCTSEYLRDITMVLPKTNPPSSFYSWKVRVRRTSVNILSQKTQNELYVHNATIISNNSFNYKNTAIVGTKISAEQFGAIPSRAYDIKGLKIKVPTGYTPTQYNSDGAIIKASYPAVWDGTFEPASFGEILPNGAFNDGTSYWTAYNCSFEVKNVGSPGYNPPVGVIPYARLVMSNSDNAFSIYQTVTPPNLDKSTSYIINGYYKVNSNLFNKKAKFEIYARSDVPVYQEEVKASDTWVEFSTNISSENAEWVLFGIVKGSPQESGDYIELANLTIFPDSEYKLKWTNNPAWIFYDIVTNKRYGLGKYVPESMVDKWSLYQISQYCDELIDDGKGGLEPRFTCNTQISDRQDAYQLLQNFISVFQGMIYWAGGQITAVKTINDRIIANYTNANVIDGKFTYSDTARSTRSTVVKVKWVNPDNYYKEAIEIVEDIDGIARYGYIVKEVTAFACTSRGQAIRVANWVLTTERYMTETITFQTGIEGLAVRPGDIFSVYDNFRKNNYQGGRITAFDVNRQNITLDRQIYIRPGYSYQLSVVNPKYSVDATSITGSNQIEQIRASQIEDRNITNGSGYYTTLSVDSGFSTGIFDGAVYLIKSVGSTNILSTADPYRCLALSETSPGIVEILGVEYNTGIDYYVDTGYNSLPNPINSGDGSYIYPPYGISSTRITGALIDNSPFDYIKYSWFNNDNNNPTIFSHFEVVMSKDGIPFYTGQSVDTFYNQNVNYTGIYNANIRSVSKGGVYSDPISWNHTISELNFHGGITLGYLNIISGNDPRLNNTGYFGNSITLNWTLPTDNNGLYDTQARFITGYEFNILDANSNAPLITPVYISGVNNRTYTISSTQMYGLNTRRFKPYIRVKDIDGNYSSGIASILNNAAPTIANLAQFYAVSGSLNYSISPNDIDQYDISGVNIWINQSIGYSPSFSSPTFSSRVLGGVLNTNLTGQYYVWYSLIDTYGIGGCTIDGPYAVTGQSLQGAEGNYVKRIYQRNFATPTTPNPTDVSPAGWYTDIPAGNDAVWVTEATINAENTSVIIPWYAPKRLSGNVNFYQPTQPDPGSYNLMNGDMWWDTSNNYKLYRYNGSSWVGAFTPFLASNGGGNITGVVTVGETGKPFVILTDAFQVWNGSSSESPFEIIGGKVYINTGYVRELTFGRIVGGTATAQELIIADSGPTHGIFRSQNYSSGVAGVCLRGDGYFEANNALIRGTLDIGTGVYHTVISDNLIQQGVMKISGGYNFYGGETNMMLNGGLGYLKIGGNNYAADLPAFLIGYKNYADSDPSFNINTWGQMGCKSMSVRQFTNDIETELSVYSRGTNTNARSTIILKNSDDNYGGGIVRISGVMSANSSNVKYFQGTNSNNNTFQIGTLSNNEVEFGANGNIGFRLRTDNNIQNWWPVMDKNGNQILADARYGSTPTNVSEIVACLQYHGLC